MTAVNPLRGEVALLLGGRTLRLRPTFSRVVAAEAETGSLLALLERVSAGDVRLGEVVALVWHCLEDGELERGALEVAVLEAGVSVCLAPYRALLLSIFKGG